MTVLTDPKGKAVHYLVCPFCILQPVEEELLRRWKWQHDRIVKCLVTQFASIGKPVAIVPDQVWTLGRLALGTRRPALILIRSRLALIKLHTLQWLNNNPSVVALFPNQQEATTWRGPSIVISDVLLLSNNELKMHDGWRHVLSEILNEPQEQKLPVKKRREVRDQNNMKIANYLYEWIMMNQGHAKSTFSKTGTSELLPCPRQKDISEATGIKKSTVSKCLKDEKAELLQLLWRVSQSTNVQECLKFKLPSSKLSEIQHHRSDLIDEIED